jgi:hypothetical protein
LVAAQLVFPASIFFVSLPHFSPDPVPSFRSSFAAPKIFSLARQIHSRSGFGPLRRSRPGTWLPRKERWSDVSRSSLLVTRQGFCFPAREQGSPVRGSVSRPRFFFVSSFQCFGPGVEDSPFPLNVFVFLLGLSARRPPSCFSVGALAVDFIFSCSSQAAVALLALYRRPRSGRVHLRSGSRWRRGG